MTQNNGSRNRAVHAPEIEYTLGADREGRGAEVGHPYLLLLLYIRQEMLDNGSNLDFNFVKHHSAEFSL
jgi:hypothetical protein